MADLQGKLIAHIDDAYAMEQNVLRMLDGMLRTTDDTRMLDILEFHRDQTKQHADRLEERLRAHGASPSAVKETGGVLGALLKMPLDMARSEHAAKNARDGYATEHVEIAAYELLERLAKMAGDQETAEVARKNRADEVSMAHKIEKNWAHVLSISLREEGVPVG